MRKHEETFHARNDHKLAIIVFNQLRRFQNKNLWYTFQTSFVRKRGLAHPYFLQKDESLQLCLSQDLRELAMFLDLEVQFFQQVAFSKVQRPGLGPIFGYFFFSLQLVESKIQLICSNFAINCHLLLKKTQFWILFLLMVIE